MTAQPGEMARLAIYVDGCPHAEVLSFKSRETAVRTRDDIVENMPKAKTLTISDEFGCEILVLSNGIRLIRLTSYAP